MRPETRQSLELVVEKSNRLRDGRYIRLLQELGGTELTYSYTSDKDGATGSIAIGQSRPDDDATDALVLTFRFFIQTNETTSFRWLATHVLDDPGLSHEWKQEFITARDDFNTFLDLESGYREQRVEPVPQGAPGEVRVVEERAWTNRDIMEAFIYGGLAHADPERWKRYKRWKSNQMVFPFVMHLFDTIITSALRAIAYIGYLSERELEGQVEGGTYSGGDVRT